MEPLGRLVATLQRDPGGPAAQALFGEVVRRFQDMALACAYGVTGDHHLAEDAAQEAFVTAWRQLPALRDPEAFPGWFRRIVISAAHRARRGSAPAPGLEAEAVEAWAEPVSALLERRDLQETVRSGLAALPGAERKVVVLYYFGEASVAEVAARLGLAATTVKSRLHAARRRLRAGALPLAADPRRAQRPARHPGFAERVAARLQPFRTDLAYFEDRADGLASAVADGLAVALSVVADLHPTLGRRTPAQIRSGFSRAAARLVVARQHGFPDWAAFAAHVAALAAAADIPPFAATFAALEAGALDRLRAVLDASPALVRSRGTNGNTLLHLAAGVGLQPACQLLLARGADPGAANDRNWTPLHQAAYSNQPALATLLLEAGAEIDVAAWGDGGTPLTVALFWGHREVAAVLAAAGIVPGNLRVAAGLGRLDLLAALLEPGGELRAQAGMGRGFYRPHSGFPLWAPGTGRQDILDEALVWAAKAGEVGALAWLVEQGARVGAEPYRGTALVWAAATGRAAAVAWLLDHGAMIDQRGTFGGSGHGQGVTALHIAAGGASLAVVQQLVERGADPRAADELFGADALGWARHGGRGEIAAFLEACGRGRDG